MCGSVIFLGNTTNNCYFSQEVPPTPGQPTKEPMFIPVALALLDSNGKGMPLSSVHHDGTLQSFGKVETTILRVSKVSTELLSDAMFASSGKCLSCV